MTLERLTEIENEIFTIVDKSLDEIEQNNFANYVLLLIRADYDERIAKSKICSLSPYIIENQEDHYMDINRQGFMLEYLQKHKSLPTSTENKETEEYSEYDINIQMMIYSHTWEAHLFLKTLERIAHISEKNKYKWQSKISYASKTNFIDHHILTPFKESKHFIYNILSYCYNNDLRNSFAHSDYYIDINKQCICFRDNNRKYHTIAFQEWDKIFFTSILLDYHLSYHLNNRRNDFIEKYGTNPVLLKRPLISDTNKEQNFYVIPKYQGDNTRKVYFKFLTKKEIE